MKSLIYISNVRLPTEKAHGLQIMKMCEAFAQADHSVTLIAPRLPTFAKDPFDYYGVKKSFNLIKIKIIQSGSYYLQGLSFSLHALWFALVNKLFQADIIYSRDVITLFLLALFGKKPVAEIHDYRFDHSHWQYGFMLRRCKSIVVNSKGTAHALTSHYTFETPLIVAPNGVDVSFFDIPETREEARTKLNLPQNKVIIGYVGRYEVAGMDKGVHMLKEAFERMKHREKAHLLLVGGPELSVPYREVPLYLRAIDIAVLPFPSDRHARTTSPIKYYEYLAAGKAIVRADSSGAQELADRLDRVVENPEQIRVSGEKNKNKAFDHTWDARAKRILDLIHEAP